MNPLQFRGGGGIKELKLNLKIEHSLRSSPDIQNVKFSQFNLIKQKHNVDMPFFCYFFAFFIIPFRFICNKLMHV